RFKNHRTKSFLAATGIMAVISHLLVSQRFKKSGPFLKLFNLYQFLNYFDSFIPFSFIQEKSCVFIQKSWIIFHSIICLTVRYVCMCILFLSFQSVCFEGG